MGNHSDCLTGKTRRSSLDSQSKVWEDIKEDVDRGKGRR